MKFSNFLFPAAMKPSQDHRVIEETLREARLCDELGMQMLWLAEHHFDGICAYVDPVTFAAALAASTRTAGAVTARNPAAARAPRRGSRVPRMPAFGYPHARRRRRRGRPP